jgi:K+-sensing histidine kinase KdpD
MTTIYRNYLIAHVGDKFVARSTDDECLLVASNQHRLNSAIDDLWDSLEKGYEPAWFTGSSAIDLDTFGPEAAPSSADPPDHRARRVSWTINYPVFALTALLVSAALSYVMEILNLATQVDVMLTMGVCAVAVAFGRKFAVIAAIISPVVFNFFAVEPFLAFTIPNMDDVAVISMNLLAAIGIPELLKLQCLQRLRGLDRTPDT